MSSKSKLHVAIFNSLRTLYESGAQDELVGYLHGTFSQGLSKTKIEHACRFIQSYTRDLNQVATIHHVGSAIPLGEIVDELKESKVPEVAISDIEIIIPWEQWSDYALANVETPEPWSFHTYTFRRTVWDRLQAEVFPAQTLYETYKNVRKRVGEQVDEEVRKRWRDALLMNKPKRHLSNQEIRQMWSTKPYALILTETRGRFDLMDLGEWKI